MTGFGRGSVTDTAFSIAIDLKSVNNRFLDLALRLPAELQAIEARIKRIVSERVARGRVEFTLQYDRTAEIAYELNRPLITGFLSALKEMQEEFSLSGEPDLNVVARLPNVMQPKREEIGPEFTAALERALQEALDDLDAMRLREGEMLHAELASRLDAIEKRLGPIEAEASTIVEEYQQKLTKKIGDMLARSDAQAELDQGRLAQEAAYISDRADISEEIARLRTHIDHFRGIMGEEKEVGKRLDFLTQELNREANTIASKTGNIAIKENALAIKSEIEKIREQVQNVE
jgi:uncharacterized protein (TIGR00255 family)